MSPSVQKLDLAETPKKLISPFQVQKSDLSVPEIGLAFYFLRFLREGAIRPSHRPTNLYFVARCISPPGSITSIIPASINLLIELELGSFERNWRISERGRVKVPSSLCGFSSSLAMRKVRASVGFNVFSAINLLNSRICQRDMNTTGLSSGSFRSFLAFLSLSTPIPPSSGWVAWRGARPEDSRPAPVMGHPRRL